MKNFARNALKNFEEIISSFFVTITVVVVITNVILRKFFNSGIVWAEEVSTISFVWSVFIGSSACYKHKMHIGIDLITKLFPQRIQRFINLIIDLLLIGINGYIVYLSIIFTRASAIKPTPVLGISSAYVSVSILAGFGLMTFHAIRIFINDLQAVTRDIQKTGETKSV